MVSISIIMSVFNSEKYLKEAIDSILKQTFRDFEFIIIDDGSSDSSVTIIKSYEDIRIKFIEKQRQYWTGGISKQRHRDGNRKIYRQDGF